MNPLKTGGRREDDHKGKAAEFVLKLPDLSDEEILRFANTKTQMSWMSSFISRNDCMRCKGWKCYHPGHFHVLLRNKFWNIMEKNQTHLNAFYNEKSIKAKDGSSIIVKDDPRFMLKSKEMNDHANLFVAVYFINEWYRGLVLKCFMKKEQHICKVLLLDFGTHYNIPVDFIRCIPEGLLTHLPAQAIRCSLQFDGRAEDLNNKRGYMWTTMEANVFEKIMQDCDYLVDFVSTGTNDDFSANTLVWKVRVKLYGSLENAADKFLATMQRKYQEHAKRMEEEKLHGPNEEAEKNPWYFLKSCYIGRLEKAPGMNIPLADLGEHVASIEAATGEN